MFTRRNRTVNILAVSAKCIFFGGIAEVSAAGKCTPKDFFYFFTLDSFQYPLSRFAKFFLLFKVENAKTILDCLCKVNFFELYIQHTWTVPLIFPCVFEKSFILHGKHSAAQNA